MVLEAAFTRNLDLAFEAFANDPLVTVNRDACGGCYNRIPPQRQVDIRQGKKLIVCEYCGRILVPGDEE